MYRSPKLPRPSDLRIRSREIVSCFCFSIRAVQCIPVYRISSKQSLLRKHWRYKGLRFPSLLELLCQCAVKPACVAPLRRPASYIAGRLEMAQQRSRDRCAAFAIPQSCDVVGGLYIVALAARGADDARFTSRGCATAFDRPRCAFIVYVYAYGSGESVRSPTVFLGCVASFVDLCR